NLVGNAIKFTPSGEVGVRLQVAAKTAREVVLHGLVRDTGVGIAPDKQEIIFEAFRQADASRARKYGGTGLGVTVPSRLGGAVGGGGRARWAGAARYISPPASASAAATTWRRTPSGRRGLWRPTTRRGCACWWPRTTRSTGRCWT